MGEFTMTSEQRRELVSLLANADKRTPVAYSYGDNKFSYKELNNVFREQIKELTGNGDYNTYRRNEHLLFELIEQMVDEVLPKKVFDNMEQFCEIRTVKHGEKVYFKQKTGNLRGRQFVTKGAFGGRYKAFRLGEKVWNVETEVHVAAARIDLEEILEGTVDFADYAEIIEMGFEQLIYKEVMRHIVGLATSVQLPTNNKIVDNKFDPAAFSGLVGITRAYGEPVIICSDTFAATIKPDGAWATDADKNEVRTKGYIGQYHGCKIVVLPQSFYENTNEGYGKEKNSDQVTAWENGNLLIPPGMAWIFPSSQDNKPVKIALEGQTIVRKFENRDYSMDMQWMKKIGVAVITNPGMTVYTNTALNEWPSITTAPGYFTPEYRYVVN